MEVRSIEAIIGALNSANVRYLIVGGLAVNAYGYERLTRDIDLVIGLEPENIIRGLRTLQGIGYRMAIPVTPEEICQRISPRSVAKGKEHDCPQTLERSA